MHYAMRIGSLLALTLVVCVCCFGQEHRQKGKKPEVAEAVMPVPGSLPRASKTTGIVIVEVKINNKGSVISTRAVSGKYPLTSLSRQTARRWKFVPLTGSTARLTFVYHPTSKDTAGDQVYPVFVLPYRVEVFQISPDNKSVGLDRPQLR
jgi:hypothetical protein